MQILYNNQAVEIGDNTTVTDFLAARNRTRRVSVWINGRQLLLSEFSTWVLQENDQVKVIRIVAGG